MTKETPTGSDFLQKHQRDSKHCSWGLGTLEIRNLCTSTLVEPRPQPQEGGQLSKWMVLQPTLKSRDDTSTLFVLTNDIHQKVLMLKGQNCAFSGHLKSCFIEDNVIPTDSVNVYWVRNQLQTNVFSPWLCAFSSSEDNVSPWTSVLDDRLVCDSPALLSLQRLEETGPERGETSWYPWPCPQAPQTGALPQPTPHHDPGQMRITTIGQRDGPWAMLG